MMRIKAAGGLAVAAGAMFLAAKSLSRVARVDDVACQTRLDVLANVLDLLKYGLMAASVLLMLAICATRLSRTARITGRIAAAGAISAGVANGVEHCAHIESLGFPYVLGLLVGLIATAVFGVFVARCHVVPAPVGWIMSLGVGAFFLTAEQGGAYIAGLAWIAVGVLLLRYAPGPAIPRKAQGPSGGV